MSETVAYASAARTATPAAFTLDLVRVRALVVVIDVTAIGPAPSVVPTLDAIDQASGKAYNLLTGTALTAATGSTPRVLRIAPGLVVAANLTANDVVPERIRLTMTHGNADSITYSACLHLLGY